MKGSIEFGVHNVDGTTVITGLTPEPLEVPQGQRVTVRQDVELAPGELRPGHLTVSDLKEAGV